MKYLSNLILRYRKTVLLLSLISGLLGAWASAFLYLNLRTDIQELLPTTARSVLDFHEVNDRLASIESLAILVFSKDTQASKRFVVDLAKTLDQLPKTTIASVEYQIQKELQFFRERKALFIDLKDLTQIRDYIRDKIEYEKSLYNPLTIFGGQEFYDLNNIREPRFDFESLKRKYEKTGSVYENLPDGFYASQDQTRRVVLANRPGDGSGVEGQRRLKSAVVKAVQELEPKAYAPDLEIKYAGGVQEAIEEQDALVEDLELSTAIVLVVISTAMWLYFKSFWATVALAISLFVGTFWTFGAAYLLVGYLNANSAFLGSIVLGNGINFGIIVLARYLEERRKGAPPKLAAKTTLLKTSGATWTAALAAGLSYGSLMLTGFRGFNQFGVIGLVGMILCWMSATLVLPCLLVSFEQIRPFINHSRGQPGSSTGWVAGLVAKLIGRQARLIWIVSCLITGASLLMISRAGPQGASHILETDLSKLRNKQSMASGAVYLTQFLDEIFHHNLTPIVVLPHSKESTQEIARLLREKQASEGEKTLIGSVQILDDFIPIQQREKIEVLKEIRSLLPRQLVERLSHKDQSDVKELIRQASLKPFSEKDLPGLVKTKFQEKDGSIGKLVLVEPPLNNATWDGNNLIRFIADLRTVADAVEKSPPVAGACAVSSDMIRAISVDGPRATLFAFLAVFFLIIILFRKFKTIALVLFSLILGVIWLGGIIYGFDLKINFLNFIALPITFGIGVDYGVNVFQRLQEESSGNILDVIRHTGSAVALCSFSTIVGYASLLIASNQGFVSFGVLAVAGELTCVIAAVIALPAFLRWRNLKADL